MRVEYQNESERNITSLHTKSMADLLFRLRTTGTLIPVLRLGPTADPRETLASSRNKAFASHFNQTLDDIRTTFPTFLRIQIVILGTGLSARRRPARP